MTKFLKGECSSCGGHIEFPAEAIGSTPEEFAQHLRVEIDKWAKVAKAAKMRAE